MTAEETENLIAAQVGAYVLTIETRGNGQESITAEQTGLEYEPDNTVKELIAGQDRFKWFLAFRRQEAYDMTVPTTYDDEKFEAAAAGLSCMQEENNKAPADAYIKETDSGFEIIPEEEERSLREIR